MLEPIKFPQSQSTVKKKIAQNELKKIVEDLGKKTHDHVENSLSKILFLEEMEK